MGACKHGVVNVLAELLEALGRIECVGFMEDCESAGLGLVRQDVEA